MAEDQERNTADEERGSNGSGDGVMSSLPGKDILVPAGAAAAAAVAAAAGPGLVRRIKDATEERGEEGAERLGRSAIEGATEKLRGGASGGVAGKALSKVLGGGGGGGGGTKKTRRLPIQRWTDVAVPIDKAYDAWTKFDQYPKFMHRVLSTKRSGNDKIEWEEKIWFSRRQWEGRITDRRKNDRIAWKTTSGMSHKGVVSFHKLDTNLTRVMVTLEFEPTGMIEKMASGLRFVKRAVQADLARFKAYVEMDDAKGLEYRPVKEDEDEAPEDESTSRGRRSGDDESRQKERSERESRRSERRESVGAK